MELLHGGQAVNTPTRPRFGWVVLTPELLTDTEFAELPVADRWGYLERLAADAEAQRPHLAGPDDWADCGVILRQRRRFPASVRQAIFDRDGNACLRCGSTERLVLDHIHPLARGGADSEANLQTLCHSCNARKWAHVQ